MLYSPTEEEKCPPFWPFCTDWAQLCYHYKPQILNRLLWAGLVTQLLWENEWYANQLKGKSLSGLKTVSNFWLIEPYEIANIQVTVTNKNGSSIRINLQVDKLRLTWSHMVGMKNLERCQLCCIEGFFFNADFARLEDIPWLMMLYHKWCC